MIWYETGVLNVTIVATEVKKMQIWMFTHSISTIVLW
jgi:hypothetical protein